MGSFYGQNSHVSRSRVTTGAALLCLSIESKKFAKPLSQSSYILGTEKDWEYWLSYSDEL